MHDGRCPIGFLVVRHVAAYCGENDDPVWTQLESHVYEYKLMFYYSNLLTDVRMLWRLCADDISSRVLELDQSTSGSRLWRICARLSSGRVPVLLWTVGLHTWFVCASHCYFPHNIFFILLWCFARHFVTLTTFPAISKGCFGYFLRSLTNSDKPEKATVKWV